jgi:hypothetical protein
MGMDFNVYVGVYAVIPEVEQKTKEQKYGCSNQECSNHQKMNSKDKFCSICGSPGIQYEIEKTVRKPVNWYRFAEANGFDVDLLSSPNETNYLIGNQKSYGECYSDDGAIDDFEFDGDYITESINDFKNDNATILAAFKNQYGVELRIVFGSFAYYS